MNIQVTHDNYVRYDDGQESETVDASHVERFLAARSFFDALVDEPERHEQDSDGSITITRVDPIGQVFVTRFVPIEAP